MDGVFIIRYGIKNLFYLLYLDLFSGSYLLQLRLMPRPEPTVCMWRIRLEHYLVIQLEKKLLLTKVFIAQF